MKAIVLLLALPSLVCVGATYFVDGNYVGAETVNCGNDLTLFMDNEEGEGPPYKRRNTTNHSDYNVFATTSWTPYLRHSWNPNNTVEEWRARWSEDVHSKQMEIEYALAGPAFRLLTTESLDCAGPLPPEARWKPPQPNRIGCARTEWP